MAKTTIYDLEGKAHEMETVDARECVAEMGWSLEFFEPNGIHIPFVEAPPGPHVYKSPENKLPEVKWSGPTREAMKSFLTTNGVTFPANIKGDKLAELYAAEKAKFEAE